MGTSYQISCRECGYDRGSVMEGFGMMGEEYEYVITPCYKCGVIKRINVKKDELVCKRCKSELESFDYDKDTHDCPKCGKPTLDVWWSGMWD